MGNSEQMSYIQGMYSFVVKKLNVTPLQFLAFLMNNVHEKLLYRTIELSQTH